VAWGNDVPKIAASFQQLCGLPDIVGAINGNTLRFLNLILEQLTTTTSNLEVIP